MDERLFPLLKTHYGLEDVGLEAKLATNGLREAYRLRSEQGPLVLKITDPNRPEEVVKSDTSILEILARHDFPASRILYTGDGRLYLPLDNRFFYLYRYIEGKRPVPSRAVLANCGGLLAELHNLELDRAARVSGYRPPQILEDIHEWLVLVPGTAEQQEMATRVWEMVEQFPSFEGLPESLIHTDPYFDNLVEGTDARLYLIDWEDGGVSYPLLDVGYLGHLTCYLPHDRFVLGLPEDGLPFTWRPDWAQAFLDAYQAVRPLNEKERELFPWAARLSYLNYLWDWGERRIIPENFQRMKIMEEFIPVW